MYSSNTIRRSFNKYSLGRFYWPIILPILSKNVCSLQKLILKANEFAIVSVMMKVTMMKDIFESSNSTLIVIVIHIASKY